MTVDQYTPLPPAPPTPPSQPPPPPQPAMHSAGPETILRHVSFRRDPWWPHAAVVICSSVVWSSTNKPLTEVDWWSLCSGGDFITVGGWAWLCCLTWPGLVPAAGGGGGWCWWWWCMVSGAGTGTDDDNNDACSDCCYPPPHTTTTTPSSWHHTPITINNIIRCELAGPYINRQNASTENTPTCPQARTTQTPLVIC